MRSRAVLLLLLPAVLLAQDQPTFYAAFQDGRDAERRGDWAAAAADYRRAIALRPAPAARVIIYGNNLLLDYYPYTRLARCELAQGRRAEAEAALVVAARQGEPLPERQALQDRLAAPAPRPAAAPTPAPTPALAPAASRPAPLGAVVPTEPEPRMPRPLPPDPSLPAPPAAPLARVPAGPGPRPAPVNAVPPAGLPPPAAVPSSPTATRPPASGHRSGFGMLGIGILAVLAGGLAWARRRRAVPSDEAFRDPERVGPYRIERRLGHGGFASTYLARQDGTHARVALKVLHPYRQDDPAFLQRFRQEARLGALLDHPNLVRILDPGPEEGTPYLAMEYVEGESLAQRLAVQGALPPGEACAIALDVARAMAHAHGRGVVHRDLKPGNILLTGAGARVMDFGIARRLDTATVTTTYAFLGTPLYAAPEAQLMTHVGPAADRYSLGVILFHMLAGAPPFQGETPFQILDAHRTAAPPDLAALCPAVPPDLAALVARLLAKDPEVRPGDDEILETLSSPVLSGPA